jgi:riboflavin biosynthesis pyrimidine reductase
MNAIRRLFEREGLPSFAVPEGLAAIYGGDFGLAHPCLYVNFVSSVNGVVVLPGEGESGRTVSGNDEADRFVMALLRACADAVVLGAGTFRKTRGDLWRAEAVFPAAKDLFAELRLQLGLRPQPLFVLVTGSGRIELQELALSDCLIVTTPQGEAALGGRTPAGARVVVGGGPRLSVRWLVDLLHREGFRRLLCEGGPTLFGQLLEERLVDELFLTLSSRLFGRAGNKANSLLESAPLGEYPLRLASLRQHEDSLFLRYEVRGP